MMNLRKAGRTLAGAAPVMLLGAASMFAGPAFAQDASGTGVTPTQNAHTIITVLPKGKEATANVAQSNLAIKVDGKPASVTQLTHFDNNQTNLELVLLIDDSARSSLGLYIKEMGNFLTALPPNVAVGVAYIENGGAHFVQPLTLNHAAAVSALRLPSGPPGANADPYFALTDLVKAWPSRSGPNMRREVVMISNGVNAYGGLRYDPEDPYVNNTITQAQKNGVIVYSIYFKDRGFAQRFGAAVNSGQNYLIQMSEATGGELYYEGFGNPVSFTPFLDEIQRNLQNQYEVSLTVAPKVKDGLQNLKVKVNAPNTKVESAGAVLVGGETTERQ